MCFITTFIMKKELEQIRSLIRFTRFQIDLVAVYFVELEISLQERSPYKGGNRITHDNCITSTDGKNPCEICFETLFWRCFAFGAYERYTQQKAITMESDMCDGQVSGEYFVPDKLSNKAWK